MDQKKRWRFLIDPPQTAAINMAIDEAISLAFSRGEAPPTFRLYRWLIPSISIGSFQKLEGPWADSLKLSRLPWVRRITGGRALLHDQELTYSLIAGAKDPLFSGGIKPTFQVIANGLLAGLAGIGIPATVYVPPGRKRSSAAESPLCFASTSWYEIVAQDRKLVGSAQRRWVTHFLQHGSLILAKSAIEGWLTLDTQIALSDLVPVLPDSGKLEGALKKGMEEALSICLEPGELTDLEKETAAELAEKKYGNPAWNLHREIQTDRN